MALKPLHHSVGRSYIQKGTLALSDKLQREKFLESMRVLLEYSIVEHGLINYVLPEDMKPDCPTEQHIATVGHEKHHEVFEDMLISLAQIDEVLSNSLLYALHFLFQSPEFLEGLSDEDHEAFSLLDERISSHISAPQSPYLMLMEKDIPKNENRMRYAQSLLQGITTVLNHYEEIYLLSHPKSPTIIN